MRAQLLIAVSACAAIAFGVYSLAHRHKSPESSVKTRDLQAKSQVERTPLKELRLPHYDGAIKLDGELDEAVWSSAVARTEAFIGPHGGAGRPYSDARMMWGHDNLYLALYAADEDIQALPTSAAQALNPNDDVFHFELARDEKRFSFEVNPMGLVSEVAFFKDLGIDSSWKSGIKDGHDLDGTLNDSTDDDEEWVIEMAIPLAALGLHGTPGERIEFFINRCDTPHHGPRICNKWGDANVPTILILD